MKKQAPSARDDDGKVEVISPPNLLRARVATADDGPGTLFAAADQAIAEQVRHYIDQARRDFAELSAAFDTAVADPAGRVRALERVYGHVHNMKGQGATFGYDMVTRIAALLCAVLRNTQAVDEAGLRVAKAHIDALGIVIEHGLTGDGGPLGQKMIARLERLARPAAS